MNRRQILVTLAVAPLAACAATTGTTPTNSAIAADIDLVASGLTTLLAYIPLTATTRARYQGYLDNVVKLGKDVANAQDANAQKSIVQQIIAAVEAALAVAASVALPGAGSTIVLAIRALMPVIAAAVGILGMRTVSTMSPQQARMVLRSAR